MKFREIVDRLVIDPRKLTDYALDPDNPKGQNKAFLFRQYLGYTKDNYQGLLDQLLTQALDSEAIAQTTDQHGTRYQVDLQIQGLQAGQRENVRTGWIVPPHSKQARLVTIYIKRKP